MYPDQKDEVVQLYLDDIIPNRFQPREVFDEKALKELAVSIKEHGVIQPIIVRSVNGKYEIIAGERRYKASALAGLTKIPAIIRDLDDKESSKVALLENLQRKNLNPIEEARTYQKILELDQMTQEELAKTMGKSQSAVANKIRLLSLSDDVQQALLNEEISERHARTLLNIPDSKKQKEMLKKVIEEKMSVRVLEEEIKKIYPKDEETEEKEDSKEEKVVQIASPDAFVNDNPLTPTAELPEDPNKIGTVTIAPPEEGESGGNKFINFGEIGKEENEEEEEIPEVKTVNVDEIKENAVDINPVGGGDSLDSLLNFAKPTEKQENPTFITPAEKIVKTDSLEDEESSEYFQMPESFQTPPVSIVNEENDKYKSENTEELTSQDASEKIKELVEELKKKGISINVDEMNFPNSYQLIIKIDKE